MARRTSGHKRVVVWGVVAALIAGLLSLPSGALLVSPGPVLPLGGMVTVDGKSGTTNEFYMVSVVAQEIRMGKFLLCVFNPEAELWSKKALFAGRSLEEYNADNRKLMEDSQKIACRVAFEAAGVPVSGEELPLPVSIDSGDILGPSAGLVFALEVFSLLTGASSEPLGKVAATGTLDREGAVGPVGGTAQKAAACQRQGIALFLVPQSNLKEAKEGAGDMEVIGVRSFQHALDVLKEKANFAPGLR